jgi:hypothetical protein
MNGNKHKEYGKHKYPEPQGWGRCEYGCGCEMYHSSSHGRAGIDPFGTCPGNPVDGNLLGCERDRDLVITQRIEELESRAKEAELRWRSAEPGAKKLARQVEQLETWLDKHEQLLASLRNLVKQHAPPRRPQR